ncbi:hypothetical protein [Collimonas silvisoli]|uniref:hypothetical protein n=1 Tax=Collimonas silvisoli TaxID=2825884 RepID=UPI001B8C7C24|nr:hypothetical protein [Collimonas silvisoli]
MTLFPAEGEISLWDGAIILLLHLKSNNKTSVRRHIQTEDKKKADLSIGFLRGMRLNQPQTSI